MGWLTRVVVVAATFVVGCASLAGIDDGPTMSEDALASSGGTSSGSSGTSSGASSGSSGASGTSGGPPPGDSGANGDSSTAQPDAADAAPACTKKKNGVACAAGADECCGRCTEDLRCHNGCTNGGCNPFVDDECCAGSYCFVATCRTCKPTGATPDDSVGGGLSARSCCNKAIEPTTMKCR